MLSLYLPYLINSWYKHIGKVQPWGNWGLVRLRSLPNWALLIRGKPQNPIYFSRTLKLMLFSIGPLPGKVHSYQGPQTPGGKKKNNNSIWSLMPKKFPEVVLSGDVSICLPISMWTVHTKHCTLDVLLLSQTWQMASFLSAFCKAV